VIAGAAWARLKEKTGLVRDAYEYSPGHPWASYNVEQQAHLVEDWYNSTIGNLSQSDIRFPYIDKIIRPGLDEPSFFNKEMYEQFITRQSAAELRAL
jgi:hypothetical protein